MAGWSIIPFEKMFAIDTPLVKRDFNAALNLEKYERRALTVPEG